MSASITFSSVSKAFPEVGPVLEGIDLEVGADSFVSLLGPSGCGKSTLLRLVIGLDTDFSGDILFDGVVRRASVAMAFQEPRLLPWRTVRGNLQLVQDGAHRRDKIEGLLELVDLGDFSEALPKALSGGMAQRVSLARALVNEPEVLLLDEPFSALDAMTRMRLQEALVTIHTRKPRTTLLVTHDIDEALFTSDRVVVLAQRPGRVVDDFHVAIPYPRDRADPQLLALKARVLLGLGHAEAVGAGVPPSPPPRLREPNRPRLPPTNAELATARIPATISTRSTQPW